MEQSLSGKPNVVNQLSLHFVRISVGLVYAWFGILKFFPSLSPAESLAKRTLESLSFYLIPGDFSYLLLAIMETAIGICFLLNRGVQIAVYVAIGHIVMTFSPMVILPGEVFNNYFIPTLVGQYILKNFVLLGALLIIKQSTEWK